MPQLSMRIDLTYIYIYHIYIYHIYISYIYYIYIIYIFILKGSESINFFCIPSSRILHLTSTARYSGDQRKDALQGFSFGVCVLLLVRGIDLWAIHR
jgi:hypothetical protein